MLKLRQGRLKTVQLGASLALLMTITGSPVVQAADVPAAFTPEEAPLEVKWVAKSIASMNNEMLALIEQRTARTLHACINQQLQPQYKLLCPVPIAQRILIAER